MVVEKGYTAIVAALLSAGADVNAKNKVRVSLALSVYLFSVSTVTDIGVRIDMICDYRLTRPLL